MNLKAPFLAISDAQIPFHAHGALDFCLYLKRHYKIPDENVLNVGDELDQFHGGMYPKGADYEMTPNQELKAAKEILKEWYAAFPKMKLAISNHGLRWVRKASHAEIPSQLIRDYRQIIEAPEGWQWQEEWIIPTKHPFRMIHGMGYSGRNGARNAAIDAGMSTLIGHLHSYAGIDYITTQRLLIWAFNCGCLIDIEAFVYAYGKYNRQKPCLGAGVIFGEGSTPIWLPYTPTVRA